MKIPTRSTLLALSAALAQTIHAQSEPPAQQDAPISTEPAPIGNGWTLQFEPAAHYIAPAGDIRLPSSTSRGQEADLGELNLDSPKLAPFAELHFARDKWRISLSGFWTNQEDKGSTADEAFRLGDLSVDAGDRLESSLEFGTFEASASYRVYEASGTRTEKGSLVSYAGIDVVGGVRFFDVDIEVNGPGGSAGVDELWAQPIIGLRLSFEFYEKFTLDVINSFGYFPASDHESFSWDIVAGVGWKPTQNIGLQFGYQQLAFTLQDGDDADEFEWSGGMAGLYAGLIIRF